MHYYKHTHICLVPKTISLYYSRWRHFHEIICIDQVALCTSTLGICISVRVSMLFWVAYSSFD